MTRYIWRDGEFRDADNKPMPVPDRDGVCMPMIVSDIEEYRSPIDGTLIGSRSSRRYDLEKHDCVPAEPRKKRKGYSNPNFALKRGLPLNEEAQEKVFAGKR